LTKGKLRGKGAKMLYSYGPVTKKMFKEILIKHQPGNRFDDHTREEFFNGAFKENPLLFHERSTRKQLFPLLAGWPHEG
jgi:hypothetical protein